MGYDGSIKIDTKVDNSGFSAGFSKMKSLAERGSAAIASSIAVISAGMVAGGKAAVEVGSSFEAAMDKVAAISGAAGEDLVLLSNKAKEMGATTKFSASESAEALQYMAMAGWKTNDMLEGISGIMSLAAADGLDLATTSDIVTDALTAFGLQAKDSTHFADVLAKASSSANTNVSMLGESFKYVAPLAGTMGYSVEDVSVALGLMANASVKGSMAGTSLKTALANLSAPTKNMKAVMDEYKISMTDAFGKSKPLIDVIKELREKFGGLSETEQSAAASTLFGKEAMSGMLAIINASDKDFDSLIANINDSNGAAEEMAKTMQDNLQGQITILKSSLEGLGIEIYDKMQDPLKNAAIEAQEYVNRLTKAFTDGGLTGMIEEAGNIFGELAVKAAEYAPQMVEAATSFITSFVSGIAANSDKLGESAKKIVVTIVDNLIKLLPKSVQKPVRDTVENIKKSFESGGLRTAINTVKTIITNLGKVISNVAKVALPLMSKALELLTGKSRALIVVATALFAAYKGYTIVSAATAAIKAHTAAVTAEKLAESAAAGAITLKQIAVGLLTGQISLATAAQYAWNLAMSMNPIGLVITAVAALTAGIAAFALTADNASDSTENLEEAEKRLEETNEELGNAYEEIGNKFSDFMSEIDNAGSILDNFNEHILISDADKRALEENMDSVQSEITEICSHAAEERRDLTGGEIQRLEELFQKMHELTEQELELERAKQNVAVTAAKDLAAAADISYEQYVERSQSVAHTAEETRSAVIAKAEEQYNEELILLQKRFDTDKSYTEAQYEADRKAALDNYNAAIDEANKVAGDTLAILEQGYLDRANALSNGTQMLNTYKAKEESEDKRHLQILQDNLQEYNAKINEINGAGLSDRQTAVEKGKAAREKAVKDTEEKVRHEESIQKNSNRQKKILEDENYQNQLAGFLNLAGLYETYTGKTDKSAQGIVNAFYTPMKTLPEKTRNKFQETMQGAINGLADKESTLYQKAANIAGSVINTLRTVFDIHSPSRVTDIMFRQVVQGGEGGLDKEAPKLYRQADSIGNTFTKRLKDSVNTNGLIAKMKAGVAAGRALVAQQLTAKVVHDVAIGTEDSNRKFIVKGDIHSHLNVDGREFAVATAPYVSEEIAWREEYA